jgi:hypothetical protein
MAYQHKEGKGSLFPNDYKTTETHPDFRGKAMWRGEIIEISMWRGETPSGAEKFSISIQEPYKKPEQDGEEAPQRPAARQAAPAQRPAPQARPQQARPQQAIPARNYEDDQIPF